MFDPRTKLLTVMILTGSIVFVHDLISQGLIVVLTFLLCHIYKVEIGQTFYRLRRFMYFFLMIIVIQSLIMKGGDPYIQIGNITFLSQVGVRIGVSYLCRVLVIVFGGAIIATSSMRMTLQGLTQLGLPYELSLMTSIGVRFLPIFMEEIKNAFLAMELRGIHINRLKLKRRIEVLGRLFVPIVYSTIIRAKRLSESIEMRGFIMGEKRSSYYHLVLKRKDYILMILIFILTIISITYKQIGGLI